MYTCTLHYNNVWINTYSSIPEDVDSSLLHILIVEIGVHWSAHNDVVIPVEEK